MMSEDDERIEEAGRRDVPPAEDGAGGVVGCGVHAIVGAGAVGGVIRGGGGGTDFEAAPGGGGVMVTEQLGQEVADYQLAPLGGVGVGVGGWPADVGVAASAATAAEDVPASAALRFLLPPSTDDEGPSVFMVFRWRPGRSMAGGWLDTPPELLIDT